MICWLMVDLGWWVSELVGNLIVLMWLGLLWFCWVYCVLVGMVVGLLWVWVFLLCCLWIFRVV